MVLKCLAQGRRTDVFTAAGVTRATLYTVPAGKIMILREILSTCCTVFAAGAGLTFYKLKSGGTDDTRTTSNYPNNDAIYLGSRDANVLGPTVFARNTIFEAGDQLKVKCYASAAGTYDVDYVISGDES